ncbi:hypothetical protein MAE02_07290 [Microvirga aerophila]|uniref:Uncharacterized protein n=1 Tax=Microvirga aerophila TaxID=670291 RepID=A0A512BM48_9HYPH|nr:hypothetical protein MAE02_07290 [Microvirga aerophila]
MPQGRPAPHGHEPFPLDGAVDEGAEPQHPGEVRLSLADPLKGLVRDDGDPAGGKGRYPMIHLLQEKAVQVDESPVT